MLHSICAGLQIVLGSFALSSQARSQSPQFLPEVDVHWKLNSYSRVYVQAKDDRDQGASDQLSIGPSVEFYLKPILRLREVTSFDLDDAKARPLVLAIGYRSVTAPGKAPTSRMEPVLTTHFPLKGGFLISDRNRADLDWKSGEFTWRYRNRLQIQRTVALGSHHFIPYIAAEPYYVGQYGKWATTDLYAGSEFPFFRHVQGNMYYEHENNTGKSPNQPANYIGAVLELYFRQR